MIGCDQLSNILNQLTMATSANAANAFGNVDMITFGDFYQFPPI